MCDQHCVVTNTIDKTDLPHTVRTKARHAADCQHWADVSHAVSGTDVVRRSSTAQQRNKRRTRASASVRERQRRDGALHQTAARCARAAGAGCMHLRASHCEVLVWSISGAARQWSEMVSRGCALRATKTDGVALTGGARQAKARLRPRTNGSDWLWPIRPRAAQHSGRK